MLILGTYFLVNRNCANSFSHLFLSSQISSVLFRPPCRLWVSPYRWYAVVDPWLRSLSSAWCTNFSSITTSVNNLYGTNTPSKKYRQKKLKLKRQRGFSCETSEVVGHGSHSFYLPLPRKHSPDGANIDCGHKHLMAAYYSFIDPERMKSCVVHYECLLQ